MFLFHIFCTYCFLLLPSALSGRGANGTSLSSLFSQTDKAPTFEVNLWAELASNKERKLYEL